MSNIWTFLLLFDKHRNVQILILNSYLKILIITKKNCLNIFAVKFVKSLKINFLSG